MITAGVDVGSITAKAAVVRNGEVLGTKVGFTGYSAGKAGKQVLDELLADLGMDRSVLGPVVATGYGRAVLDFADQTKTEIICHAAGAFFINKAVRTVVDVGGQDSKAIRLDQDGRVVDFVMNDKCAAGTGRFLEVMARTLHTDLESFGELSTRAADVASISSICTVFAESEVVSLIAKGTARESIVAGIHDSAAVRIGALAKKVGVRPVVMMTGGVARNSGMVRALENNLKVEIVVDPLAQVAGAIGAAILAARIE